MPGVDRGPTCCGTAVEWAGGTAYSVRTGREHRCEVYVDRPGDLRERIRDALATCPSCRDDVLPLETSQGRVTFDVTRHRCKPGAPTGGGAGRPVGAKPWRPLG